MSSSYYDYTGADMTQEGGAMSDEKLGDQIKAAVKDYYGTCHNSIFKLVDEQSAALEATQRELESARATIRLLQNHEDVRALYRGIEDLKAGRITLLKDIDL